VARRTTTPLTRAAERTKEITRSIARPTPEHAKFGRRRSTRLALQFMATFIAVAAAFALLVFPLRDYVTQRSAIAQKVAEFDVLADINEQLQNEVNALSTPEGIRNAARAQLGYVFPEEQRMSLVQVDQLPTTLPSSWPYTLVTNIVTIRTAEAATSSKALAPLAP
jgi:cell division protein FtsB